MTPIISMILALSMPIDAPAAAPDCSARDFDLYFESWRADLSEDARAELKAVQDGLAGCRIDEVKIVGMAGAPGDVADNDAISRQRAEAVSAALQAGGWDPETFVLVAIGEKGAGVDDMDKPMRRKTRVIVKASIP